ncbi:hypothetical protein MKX01_022977 [Papaver californicum]|nr:hypothetical protein MKX01_022977 [Papaver californicum]
MGRAKLNMELIAKEKSRNSTYFKRKKGLMKKLHEFKTLCGVHTLMIAYGPKQGDRPVEVEIFPDKPNEVHGIINRYQQVPEEHKVKRTLTLKNFFEDQKKKSEAELVKLRKKNQELHHISLDDLVTLVNHVKSLCSLSVYCSRLISRYNKLQQLYHNLDVKKELVEQRIKSMKAMNSSRGVMADGSKRIAEFPNSIIPYQIPYHTPNTYNNHDDTLWRREDIMYSQPFGYPLPTEYHHPNSITTTKDYQTDHENIYSISNNSTPMFLNPMMGTDGSNCGYLNMGTFSAKNNQLYWDRNYANQHMGSAMMSTASMYHPLGPGVSFQMQHQFPFMNPPHTHHQQQFMSSGSSSQMHQQSSSTHFDFEDQTNN